MDRLCVKGAQFENEAVRSLVDLEDMEKRAEEWKQEARKLLRSSFSDSGFVDQFDESDREMKIPGTQGRNTPIALHTEAKKIRDKMISRIRTLRGYINLVSVCDLIRGEALDLEFRKKFTIKQKKDFLLRKLSELDNGSYHGINILMTGNGVPIRDYNQVVEMGKSLEQEGYIDTIGGSAAGIFGKITLAGQQHIEEQLAAYSEDYSEGPDSVFELAEKINVIKETLDQQGVHHQVLFDEMEELKKLVSTMDKKNFGQLLKGKLVDLVLDKVISWETAAMIFGTLFGHGLKLLP